MEKKEIKISLGTVICICIIVILLIVIVAMYCNMKNTNYKEIKSLTKQRDELLPLLMNGQVSVNSDLSLD